MLNVHELFWMLQCNFSASVMCNLTKSDESTFFVLNVDWVFVRNWVLPYINENTNAQLRWSLCYISTFLFLSLLHLVQVKQIVKAKYISTHQTLIIRRKTLRFPRSCLRQNVTHPIRVIMKYQDFYHCGRWWLHHHNSRGFHMRLYSVKQCLTPTTYFFMF